MILQFYLLQLRSDLEAKVAASLEPFTVVKLKTQVVAGTNYFVKVRDKLSRRGIYTGRF